jgi:ribosomal protein S18 acetylase RimI-like enzyme
MADRREYQMVRYTIIDSHRNMKENRRKALAQFFTVSKQLSKEKALEQVGFCDWYESEYAVKWFEVVTAVGDTVVGYLRCLRNPDDIKEWYIGDVYVLKEYRKRKIASHMYDRVFKELGRYEAAERVIATVNKANTASIGFHMYKRFSDTGKNIEFASFYADPDETVYVKRLFKVLPFPEDMPDEKIKSFILPLWTEYCKKSGISGKKKKEQRLDEIMKARRASEIDFRTIWSGNSLVGFHCNGEDFIP